jgi:hypothetical protein
MRFLFYSVSVAALVMAPLQASADEHAKADGEGPPALRLELDGEQLKITPAVPQQGATLAPEPEGVRRARMGVGISASFLGAGLIMLGAGLASCNEPPEPPSIVGNLGACGVAYSGAAIAGVGLIGLVVSAALLGTRNREHRNAQASSPRKERRVRWDLPSGKVVF